MAAQFNTIFVGQQPHQRQQQQQQLVKCRRAFIDDLKSHPAARRHPIPNKNETKAAVDAASLILDNIKYYI